MPYKDKDKYKTEEYKRKQAQWSKNHYQRNKATILARTYERKIAMYNVYLLMDNSNDRCWEIILSA